MVAAMGALDWTAPLLHKAAQAGEPSAGPQHTLLLVPSQAVDVSHVIELLRTTYHHVVEVTAVAHANTSHGAATKKSTGCHGRRSHLNKSRAQFLSVNSSNVFLAGMRSFALGAISRPEAAHSEEETELRALLRDARLRAKYDARQSSDGTGAASVGLSSNVGRSFDSSACDHNGGSSVVAVADARVDDKVGEAIVLLLLRSERRVFAHLRFLSNMAICWGICACLSVVFYLAVLRRLPDLVDDGSAWIEIRAMYARNPNTHAIVTL